MARTKYHISKTKPESGSRKQRRIITQSRIDVPLQEEASLSSRFTIGQGGGLPQCGDGRDARSQARRCAAPTSRTRIHPCGLQENLETLWKQVRTRESDREDTILVGHVGAQPEMQQLLHKPCRLVVLVFVCSRLWMVGVCVCARRDQRCAIAPDENGGLCSTTLNEGVQRCVIAPVQTKAGAGLCSTTLNEGGAQH